MRLRDDKFSQISSHLKRKTKLKNRELMIDNGQKLAMI